MKLCIVVDSLKNLLPPPLWRIFVYIMKMQTQDFSETLVNIHQTKWQHNAVNNILNSDRQENFIPWKCSADYEELQVIDLNTRVTKYAIRKLNYSGRWPFLHLKNIKQREGEVHEVCGSSDLSRFQLNNSILNTQFSELHLKLKQTIQMTLELDIFSYANLNSSYEPYIIYLCSVSQNKEPNSCFFSVA